MKRVHILVEGQTEETFVRTLLAPHLLRQGLAVTAILATTKRVKAGGKFRGGIVSFGQVRRDLKLLLRDSGVAAVTTMMDFYGLPADFPGMETLPPQSARGARRAQHLEAALHAEFGDPRFLPYLSVHEFEALLLAEPDRLEKELPGTRLTTALTSAVSEAGSPEEVNDGAETHPAARIRRLAPRYRKAITGPVVAARIGLPTMRQKCPHFSAWVEKLEALGR